MLSSNTQSIKKQGKHLSNKEISYIIIDACKQSGELNLFAKRLFNKKITYIRGLALARDEYTENKHDDLPLILIDSVKRKYSLHAKEKTYIFGIQTKIVHINEHGNMPKIDSVISYTGIDEIEELNEMIIRAILACPKFCSLKPESFDSYAEPLRHITNTNEYRGFIDIVFTANSTTCIGGKMVNVEEERALSAFNNK